jgi:hypothetical protein
MERECFNETSVGGLFCRHRTSGVQLPVRFTVRLSVRFLVRLHVRFHVRCYVRFSVRFSLRLFQKNYINYKSSDSASCQRFKYQADQTCNTGLVRFEISERFQIGFAFKPNWDQIIFQLNLSLSKHLKIGCKSCEESYTESYI